MPWDIRKEPDGDVIIEAGILKKHICFGLPFPRLEKLLLDDANLLSGENFLVSMKFWIAEPDEMPRGIPVDVTTGGIVQENVDEGGTDGLKIDQWENLEVTGEHTSWKFIE